MLMGAQIGGRGGVYVLRTTVPAESANPHFDFRNTLLTQSYGDNGAHPLPKGRKKNSWEMPELLLFGALTGNEDAVAAVLKISIDDLPVTIFGFESLTLSYKHLRYCVFFLN